MRSLFLSRVSDPGEDDVGILDKVGYKGYLSIEYEAEEAPMTAVPKFAAHLRSLVDRL